MASSKRLFSILSSATLSVFLLNLFAFSVSADTTDTDGDHIYDEDEILYGFDLANPDENANGVIDGEDDYEGDGLITQSELYLYGTDPTDLDTDGDGRGDYNEIFVSPTSDPLDMDSDDDGLGDYAEFITHGTDPENPDTDGDGMGDYYEAITLADAGITSSPTVFDTDGNGTSDGQEDYDGDGLSNNDEQLVHGTDPIATDTDEDGASDGEEVAAETDPLVDESSEESTFSLEAGDDEAVGFGNTYTLTQAYAMGAEALTSATIDWGDGSAVSTAIQTVDGGRILLSESHDYAAPDSYPLTVCASDGVTELCDSFRIYVVGNSSGDSSSSSSSSNSSSTEIDQAVDLSGEEDQEVVLTEDGEEDQLTEETEPVSYDCSEMLFEDISEEDDFYDAVCQMWGADIIHGRTETQFAPDELILRDEASKIFTRLFGYFEEAYGETPEVTESSFIDVEASDPLAYYVEVATGELILEGETDSILNEDGEIVSESTFAPHEALSAYEFQNAMTQINEDLNVDLAEEGYTAESSITRGNFLNLLIDFLN